MTAFLRALTLGIATGLRSIEPMALLSWGGASGRISLQPPFRRLADPAVMNVLGLAALGEVVGDKLPFTPSRTWLPILSFRIGMGAAAGAAVCSAEGESTLAGAAAGGLAAAAGTYAGYAARMFLIRRLGLPNPLAGSLGDVAAILLSLAALDRGR